MSAPPSAPPPPQAPAERRRFPVKRVLLIAAAVVVFVLVSGLLARFLSAENTERDADLALIQAQARGDVPAMLASLSGCAQHPACVATVRANAANARLRRPGAIKILSLESGTAYSPTGKTAKTRLAWTVIGTLPVVQCITVRRTGNFVSGIKVALLDVSAPIQNEGGC